MDDPGSVVIVLFAFHRESVQWTNKIEIKTDKRHLFCHVIILSSPGNSSRSIYDGIKRILHVHCLLSLSNFCVVSKETYIIYDKMQYRVICFLSLVLDIALVRAGAPPQPFSVVQSRGSGCGSTVRASSVVENAQVLLWELLHLKSSDELSGRPPGSIGTWILGLCHE